MRRACLPQAGNLLLGFTRPNLRGLSGSHRLNRFRQGTASAVPKGFEYSGVLTPEAAMLPGRGICKEISKIQSLRDIQ